MERNGVAIKKLYTPSKIKIEVQKLDEGKWHVQYAESFDKEPPKEAFQFTVMAAKRLGIEAKREGNTFSYEIICSIEQFAGVIVGEFLQFTPLAKLTITEMLALTALGLGALKDMPSVKKELRKERGKGK